MQGALVRRQKIGKSQNEDREIVLMAHCPKEPEEIIDSQALGTPTTLGWRERRHVRHGKPSVKLR